MIDVGLDISTTCTGVCVLRTDGSLLKLQFIKLDHLSGLWKKADEVKSILMILGRDLGESKVRHIFVEENLQMFRPGLSSAKTLTTLSRFNGIVSYAAREVFHVEPTNVNVNRARKAVGLKIDRKDKSKTTKEKVLEWVHREIIEDQFVWPTKVLKSGPRKGETVLVPGCYDMADAYVTCRAGQAACT